MNNTHLIAVLLLTLPSVCFSRDAPQMIWASDPIRPGETLLLTGEGFTSSSVVELGDPASAKTWVALNVLQRSAQSLKAVKEIHALALRRHPDIEPWLCSWWWTPEEHAQFNDWAAKEAPGWLKAMTLHIEYGQTRPKDVALPAGCRKLAFVHVGYGDRRDTEVYGRQGAVIAPQRLPETLSELQRLGFEGFQAYSEGVFDDLNKTLLAGLGSGHFDTADTALRAYAQRYFNAAPERAADWARWLAQWGDRKQEPLPAAADEFARLAADVKPAWRLDHWRIKIELEALDRAIGTLKQTEWTDEKLALAEQWFATQERLYREVYRLGPVRHVLNPRIMPPAWYESWSKATVGKTSGFKLLQQQ